MVEAPGRGPGLADCGSRAVTLAPGFSPLTSVLTSTPPLSCLSTPPHPRRPPQATAFLGKTPVSESPGPPALDPSPKPRSLCSPCPESGCRYLTVLTGDKPRLTDEKSEGLMD